MCPKFGNRFKRLVRIELDLSQQKFADRCGVMRSNVQRWVNGSYPSGESIADMMMTFPDVDWHYILTGEKR